MIKTYIPVMQTIQAVQFTRDNWDEILEFTKGKAKDFIIPRTPDGIATCGVPNIFGYTPNKGDYGYTTVKEGEYIIKTSRQNHFIHISEAKFLSYYKEAEKITDG